MADRKLASKKGEVNIWRYYIAPVIAVGLPALGYAFTYVYEMGFCDVFGIPTSFIELSLANVLNAIFAVVIYVGVAVLIWYVFVYYLLMKCPDSMRYSVSVLSGALLPFVVLMLLYQDIWGPWVEALVGVMIAWAIVYYGPLLWKWAKEKCFRKRKSRKEEQVGLKACVGTQPNKNGTSANKPVRRTILVVLTVMVFLFWCSHTAGQATAERQERYLIPSTHNDSAVLRTYGENIICVPVVREEIREKDSMSKQFRINGNLFILRAKSDSSLVLTLEEIGRVSR